MHRVELKVFCISEVGKIALPFLMHRVELKASSGRHTANRECVPNAPCGVESLIPIVYRDAEEPFLMHRVELKVVLVSLSASYITPFLMHRVELKGL